MWIIFDQEHMYIGIRCQITHTIPIIKDLKICIIFDKLKEMVVGSPTTVGVKKIYDTQP